MDAVARAAGRELTPRETGETLSSVAVRVVREALAASEPDLPLAVIGMGKLGARELNVASDLDLVFVYEGEGADAQQRAGAIAERVMRHVRDAGWEPDADLRPEGRNGPLARSHRRATSSTGSATRSRGSSSRSCARARRRRRATWDGGSS